uniref:Uncharacterized protein n=1 Tax=uncultured marine group II/III euryarchaeote KM3_190_A05 TaxID=1457960 RepID=A0A075GV45_9EURY|nr:hypothetical protein [uncultured marine group II/III euryarchaeote KM3_190_A05]
MRVGGSVAEQRSTLLQRFWLTIIVCGQVLLAPAIAFSATYFIDFGGILGERPLLRVDLIPWILSGSLGYGILSLILALVVGGWMPISVADKGGWMPVLGASRLVKDAAMVDRARTHLLTSPSGKMMQIVNREMIDGDRTLLEVHGGLQMLAAPLQILLAISPLLMLKFVPSEWLVPNRLLELSMVGYLVSLALILRSFPNFAQRFVGAASTARRFLVTVTKINWMFPVLILWLVGRIIVGFAFELIQPDVSQWQQIALEKSIIEAFLPVNVEVPETSFLDMLVALAVLPLATFTTMAVLGGGRHDLPDWLVNTESQWENLEDSEQLLLSDGSEIDSEDDEQEDLQKNDEDGEQNNADENEEAILVKGNKGEMLSALAKAKETTESNSHDDD